MPKGLSLKKVQSSQNHTAKNQKSITHFFRNVNNTGNTGTQNNERSPSKTVQSPNKPAECKPVKRKATFISKESVKELTEPSVSLLSANQDTATERAGTPKKFKPNSDLARSLSPVKKNMKSDSPKKPVISKSSPHKENGFLNHEKKQRVLKVNDFGDTVDERRSPLTPVDIVTKENLIQKNLANHVPIDERESIYKVYQNHVIRTPSKTSNSPNKIIVEDFSSTPGKLAKLRTPEKLIAVLSPSKCGSTVKALDFDGGADGFCEDWGVDDFEEEIVENLDLTRIQRCEIMAVKQHPNKLELQLKNAENHTGTCFVEGVWLHTPLVPGEIISVLAARGPSNHFQITNTSGLLVLRPDHLISATSVVAGVFCKRKAVLQERWKGIDSGNVAMTIGILVHELVQKALTEKIMDVIKLRIEADRLIKESIQSLYDAELSEQEARSNMEMYIGPLADFMQTYVGDCLPFVKPQKENWSGRIKKVLDIEENICCPQLGLKGKIDATLEVTIHGKQGRSKAIVPLELKSGKASVSAEHRGQLALYMMALNIQSGADVNHALLLYLKERVDLREVSSGHPERRDLMMLRNELVQHLAPAPHDVDPEQLTDIEDAAILLQQKLPEPVHHQTACAKCPYLTLCSLHMWHTDGPSVSESHPLSKLRPAALDHLSPQHIQYFLHWTALLKMEEKVQLNTSPLRALWTDTAEKRAQRGVCAANLTLQSVETLADRFLHVFRRGPSVQESLKTDRSKKGPEEGEFSIVSINNRPWIAAGVVSLANDTEIHIMLDRDVSGRLNKSTVYHIDTYESYATVVQNLTNLGVLMEDSERAQRLRRLIIDKDPPTFEAKLPREVGRLGTKLMRSLNIQQQRAVLKSLAANDYALLKGLPGTGKTQTISVLIQMLVSLKKRVLVTAHTHSAVDTVLSRLPDTLRIMRLGSSSRVASSLADKCEHKLTAGCQSPEELGQLYDSMEVVGVTCLGASHAMLAKTTFDICIVDEATQVLQSTVLRPLFAAKRFVLVGDPDQLPPVVRSKAARRLGMEDSLFHRLMIDEATSTLQLQYRMNQPLVDVANKVAYSDRLKCADPNVAKATLNINMEKISLIYSTSAPWLVKACSTEEQYTAIFLDMKVLEEAEYTDSGKTTNVEEACVVLAILEALKEGGVSTDAACVLAPYRAQVALLRAAGARASTVDQYQGRDCPAVLYCCSRRQARDAQEGEVLNDQRRLAVSVTRAKHKLIVIGNSRALRGYSSIQRLIDACTTVAMDREHIKKVVQKFKSFVV